MKVLLLFFIMSAPSYALDCGLSLSVNNIIFNWGNTDQIVTASLTMTRTNTDNACRKFEIGFSRGSSGSYNRRMYKGSDYLEYNIFKRSSSNSPLKLIADASNSEKLKVHFKGNQTTLTETFEGRLPIPNAGRTFISKGFYSDTLTAEAISKWSWVDPTSSTFNILVDLPPSIDISLVDSGGPFDENDTTHVLDFGVLSTGESLGMDLKVRSNAGYAVSLSSHNDGKLKHTSANYFVNYTIKINNIPYSLTGSSTSPVLIGQGTGTTPIDGVNFAVEVEIGDTSNKLQGQYADIITVTAMSTD